MMKKTIFSVFALLLPFLSLYGTQLSKQSDMLRDLDIIQNTFQVKYAPTDWKQQLFQWNLQSEIDKAKTKILAKDNPSIKDYRRIVKQFFNSTKDFHVGVHFVSTEMAFLPLRVESANDRYFITALDKDFLPRKARKLKVGDEVLSIDGKPVKQTLNELRADESSSNDTATDYAITEHQLTMRLGSEGQLIPKGKTTFEIKSEETGKTKQYVFEWDYYGEMIKGLSSGGVSQAWPDLPHEKVLGHPFFHKKMSLPLHDRILAAKKRHSFNQVRCEYDEEWVHEMVGYRKSRIPRLGTPIWELKNSSYFDAYIYTNSEGKNVGFIRIPTFLPEDCATAAKQFGEIVNLLEANTDCLIIDQLSNPGGDLFYMYALLSMLTDKPLDVPTQQETLTQLDAMFVLQLLDYFTRLQQMIDVVDLEKALGDDFSGYPVNETLVNAVCNYSHFILSEWNTGHILTQPCYLYGIEHIVSNSQGCYTKPILVLINELDFSCGDFFPAILQDNHRATLMGKKTSGAGGYVISAGHHNLFGIAGYSLTGSIAERSSNEKIENLGVSPDISYQVTESDLKSHYQDFRNEINKVVNSF